MSSIRTSSLRNQQYYLMMVELEDSQYKNKFAKIKTKILTIPAFNDFDIIVIHIQMDTN